MIWKFPATGVKSGERISNDLARRQRPFRASDIQALFEGHLVDRQAAETLHIRTTSYAELRFDVTRMPEGKRKNDLAPRVEQGPHLFKGRTLTFDVEAAEHLAQILTRTEKIGRDDSGPRCIYRSHRHGAWLCRGDTERRSFSRHGRFHNQPLGISSGRWVPVVSQFPDATAS
jgi:hypothetical protein